jgi:hypothetical protein
MMLEEDYLTIYSEFTRREIFKEALIIADNYTTELNNYKLEIEKTFEIDDANKSKELKKN